MGYTLQKLGVFWCKTPEKGHNSLTSPYMPLSSNAPVSQNNSNYTFSVYENNYKQKRALPSAFLKVSLWEVSHRDTLLHFYLQLL